MKLYIFSQVKAVYDTCPAFTVLATDEDSAWEQIQGYIKQATAEKPEYKCDELHFVTNRNDYHVQVFDVSKPMVAPHFTHD